MFGYTRKIATLKEEGKMKVTEGKEPMAHQDRYHIKSLLIRYITGSTTNSDKLLNVMAHTFLLFCGNLISRANSCAAIMYDRISWEDDSLVITFPRAKNDQEGRKCEPKHVYANPINPETCPILKMTDLGIVGADVGTHSFRKGVASFLSSCPGGPQAVSVWHSFVLDGA
ncbi:hypothetical protein THRCLA_23145, partial [Thraustotheca clavata]